MSFEFLGNSCIAIKFYTQTLLLHKVFYRHIKSTIDFTKSL